jgi:hypothetical protein
MQPNFKHYADYFSMGFTLGLCSHTEIIHWTDQLIEHGDQPRDWMIELSTSASKHPLDVMHLLDSVPGERNIEISMRLLVAKLGIVYPHLQAENGRFAKPEHSRLLSRLYSLVTGYDCLPDDIRGNIYQIDNDLDYVEQGYGDWSIIERDYDKLLATANDYKQLIHFQFD